MKNIIKKIKRKLKKQYSIEDYRDLGVIIGDNTNIIDCNIDIGHAYLIEIGDNCTLTHCTVLSHDASTKRYLNKVKVGIVKVGNNCYIGWGAIILPNITIGNNCIIGAGTIVSKNIPDNSVVVGNPCKIIKKTTEFIDKHKESMKTRPVFDTYWKNKTIIQKQEEKEKLRDTFGYDE